MHHFALLSLIYMIGFVALFDCRHLKGLNARFCKNGLMSHDDVNRLLSIMSACQE